MVMKQINITLYHYTRTEYLSDILLKGRMKLTEAGQSNDPFEMNPSFEPEPKATDQEKILMADIKKAWPLDKADEPSFVVCLSASVSSYLMWGHYANQHKGVCLAFSVPIRIRDNCLSILLNEQEYPLMPIQYEKERIQARKYVIKQTEKSYKYEIGNLLRRMLSYKPEKWAYEKEFRILVPSKDVKYEDDVLYTSLLAKSLSGVILGVNNELSIQRVRAMLNTAGYTKTTKVLRAELHAEYHRIDAKTGCSLEFIDMMDLDYHSFAKLEAAYITKPQMACRYVTTDNNDEELYIMC